MRPFLTARWVNLINVTYAVPPELLLPHVPPGVELDVQDGQAFASLVAFDFLDTRLRGMHIPWHVNFPEINLRYYLRYGGRRGVAFLKELVPRQAIALTARWIYNEPYEAVPMHSECREDETGLQLQHRFRYGGRWHELRARASHESYVPAEDSREHYFKEHDIGFGRTHRGKALAYEVRHPRWAVYPITDLALEVDFARVYGPEWGILAELNPLCSLWAKGSPVEVYPAQPLSAFS